MNSKNTIDTEKGAVNCSLRILMVRNKTTIVSRVEFLEGRNAQNWGEMIKLANRHFGVFMFMLPTVRHFVVWVVVRIVWMRLVSKVSMLSMVVGVGGDVVRGQGHAVFHPWYVYRLIPSSRGAHHFRSHPLLQPLVEYERWDSCSNFL